MRVSPLFTLILGLMIGLVLGYALAEHGQRIRPVPVPAPAAPAAEGLPAGHPPVGGSSSQADQAELVAKQAAELEARVNQSPDDPRPMVMLGNLHFDAGSWPAARVWYERALKLEGSNPDVITDLAVVYRRLQQPERALELLQQAISIRPEHPIAWYNKVVILHYDLHQHDEAKKALTHLQQLDLSRTDLDISTLASEVNAAAEHE